MIRRAAFRQVEWKRDIYTRKPYIQLKHTKKTHFLCVLVIHIIGPDYMYISILSIIFLWISIVIKTEEADFQCIRIKYPSSKMLKKSKYRTKIFKSILNVQPISSIIITTILYNCRISTFINVFIFTTVKYALICSVFKKKQECLYKLF